MRNRNRATISMRERHHSLWAAARASQVEVKPQCPLCGSNLAEEVREGQAPRYRGRRLVRCVEMRQDREARFAVCGTLYNPETAA